MNTPSTRDEERLRRALHAQAGRGAPQPVGLESVTGRARRIRRRRTTLTGLVTAAVAALAIPTGVQVNTALQEGDATPPVAGEPTGPVGRVSLDIDRLGVGEAPAVPWLDRSTLVTADGDRVELDRSHRQVAAFGEGYVVQGIADDQTGERVVELVDAGGDVTWSAPTLDAVAVSPDATLLALTGADGRLQLLAAGEAQPRPLEETRSSQPVRPVAVTGTAPCESDCSVYYEVSGPDAGVNVLSGDGHLENAGPFERLDAVTPDGLRAGQVSSQGTSSCSAVMAERREQWQTCDHSLSDFSPSGAHLVGTDAYLDGAGRSRVALLDATTGEAWVTYEVDTRAGEVIADWTWEDDEHLLVTVHSEGSWQVVRVALDGTAELATGAVPGEAHQSSLVLADHP